MSLVTFFPKTCQALREGAPELRRRRSKSFEEKVKRKDTDEESLTDRGDNGSRDADSPLKERSVDKHQAMAESDARDDCEESRGELVPVEKKEPPPVIRPSARLMKRSTTMEITMEELTPMEREMYLRDFLPPDSAMRSGSKQREVYRIARHYEPVAEDESLMDRDDDSWVEEV